VALGGANFAADAYAEFNLSSGTLTATGAGADGATIESAGSGWYRVSVRGTAIGTGGATFERYAMSGGSTTFAGDAVSNSTYFWGSQLEEGSGSPGGYVATTNAARTGVVATANINGNADGSDDGSASVTAGQVTVLTGDAKGLIVFESGFTVPTSVTLNYTIGLGADMFFQLGSMLDTVSGNIAAETSSLTDQNEVNNTRVTEMTARLDYQRDQLLERFIAMESAIARSKGIMDSLKQQTDALYQNN
jgi:flagellar capping protein FliD